MKRLIAICFSISILAGCAKTEIKKEDPPPRPIDSDRREFTLIPQTYTYQGPKGVVFLPSEQFVVCERGDFCPVPQNRFTERVLFKLPPPLKEEPIGAAGKQRLNETLFATISFREKEADLDSDALKVLDGLFRRIRSIDPGTLRVVIAGYTDSVGSSDANALLAEDRALSVASYAAEQGIPDGQIKAAGRPGCCYIDTNDTPEGRARNRRAEIFIEPIEE